MNGEEVTAPEAVLVVRFEGEKFLVDLTRGREVRCYQQPKDEQLHLCSLVAAPPFFGFCAARV